MVNVARRDSVHQTIDRMLRSGLTRLRETRRDEGRSERVDYEITDDGLTAHKEWLKAMIGQPAAEFVPAMEGDTEYGLLLKNTLGAIGPLVPALLRR